jgi:light-regulated signal transduction histidine kinase (bacteriophytochrome)
MLVENISRQLKVEMEIISLNGSLEKKVIDRTAQLQEANKELESFSYSVSHGLRTPLTIIHGYAQVLLQEESKFDKGTLEMLKAIMGSAEKMAELIDDMLTLSKAVKTEAKIVKLDMTEMATKTYTELEKSMSGSVKADITINPLLPCYADHNLIMKVFTNLLSNAIKYSSHAAKPKIIVDSYKQGRENIYSVKDNGAGFDMKNYDKLFGVFQPLHSSREFEGTGVGLALVKRIITKHSGRVWAEAEPGKGATFYFSLPNIKQ